MTDLSKGERVPRELASPDMYDYIGEATNERSILMGALLKLTGRGAELSGEVYELVLRSVERRHLLPEGTGKVVLQRCVDEWTGHVDLLKTVFHHHKADVE